MGMTGENVEVWEGAVSNWVNVAELLRDEDDGGTEEWPAAAAGWGSSARPGSGKQGLGKYSAPGMHMQHRKKILVTPWFPKGVYKAELTLEGELAALAAMMQLTDEEARRRGAAHAAVQAALRGMWSDVEVNVYGSFAYGMALPMSGVDLLVEGLGDRLDDVDAALARLVDAGFTIHSRVATNDIGYAKVESAEHGVTAQLMFVRGASTARATAEHMKREWEAAPYAKAAYVVARLMLLQARCGDAAAGGLSSYALQVMVLDARALHAPGEEQPHRDLTPTAFLLSCFRFYCEFRPDLACVHVDDPQHPGNNLAAGCVRWPQIRSVLRNAVMSLERWGAQRGADKQFATRAGYRGRSPLSSILAYDTLWAEARPGTVRYGA